MVTGHRPFDDNCDCWLCVDDSERARRTAVLSGRTDDAPSRFSLRVPILPMLPALAVTLLLAGLVWMVTW